MTDTEALRRALDVIQPWKQRIQRIREALCRRFGHRRLKVVKQYLGVCPRCGWLLPLAAITEEGE